MIKLIMRSPYIRTGFLVLAFHAFFLFLMVYGEHGTVEKGSNLVLVREVIELKSALVSKAVNKYSAIEKSIPKSDAKIKHFYPAGDEQINTAQVHSVASASLSLPSADSSVLNNPKPPYPISSRENGEEGRVYLSACINEHGKIDRLDLAKSSGFHALDRSALNTVRHWEFIPAHQNGKAIALCYRLPIHFVLSSHLNLL
jgi:TonB family protein